MPSARRERYEYRVVWRRDGNQAEQTKIVGLKPTAEKTYRMLLDEHRDARQGLNPVVMVRLDRRRVGHWETIYRQEATP